MLSSFSKMLLIEGLDDWVMLAALRMGFLGRHPSPDEFVAESRAAIKPLLCKGLMVMGDLTGVEGFHAWNLSAKQCLDRFEKEYRDDPTHMNGNWSCGIWLSLTPKGKIVAEEFLATDPDPLHIEEWNA
jgi:hypothetical protein